VLRFVLQRILSGCSSYRIASHPSIRQRRLAKKFPNRFGPHHQDDVELIWRNYALAPEELKGIFLSA
jgi:hypothetical protein